MTTYRIDLAEKGHQVAQMTNEEFYATALYYDTVLASPKGKNKAILQVF